MYGDRRKLKYLVSAAIGAGGLVGAMLLGVLSASSAAMVAAVLLAGGMSAVALTRPRIAVLLLLMIGGLPLGSLTGGEKSLFSGYGGASVRGVLLVSMVAMLIIVLAKDGTLFRPQKLELMLWLLPAIATVTLIWTPDVGEGARVLAKITYPVLVMMAARRHLWHPSSGRSVVRALSFAGLSATALGISAVAVHGLNAFNRGSGFAYSIGSSHPTPSGFFLVSIFAFFYLPWRIGRGRCGLLALLFGLQAVLTLSRMAVLGVIVVMVIGELVPLRGRLRWRRALLVGLAAAVLVTFAVLSVPALQSGFFYSPQGLESAPQDLVRALNDQGRAAIRNAMLSDQARRGTWLLGSGIGSSTIGFLAGDFTSGTTAVAHNEYLRVLYETGVVGLGALVLSVAALLGSSLRSLYRSEDGRVSGAIALSLSVCYAVFAATDNVIDYYSMFSQYVMLAVALAVLVGSRNQGGASLSGTAQ